MCPSNLAHTYCLFLSRSCLRSSSTRSMAKRWFLRSVACMGFAFHSGRGVHVSHACENSYCRPAYLESTHRQISLSFPHSEALFSCPIIILWSVLFPAMHDAIDSCFSNPVPTRTALGVPRGISAVTTCVSNFFTAQALS